MPPQRRLRVTVVDDDRELHDVLREALRSGFGARVAAYPKMRTTIDVLTRRPPDLLMVDVLLIDREPAPGWALVTAARAHPLLAGVPIILTTGDPYGLKPHAAQVAALGGVQVLLKPFSLEQLEAAVRAAIAWRPDLPPGGFGWERGAAAT